METQQDDSTEAATILNILNADCWRLMLDYVPFKDIVRSERVSRAWRGMVVEYLAGVHNYGIRYSDNSDYYDFEPCLYNNYHIIELPEHALFEEVIKKIGPFVVSLMTSRIDQGRLEAITVSCPNLESLMMGLTDDDLNDVVTGEILEELTVVGIYPGPVTGCFLANLRTHLKTVAFHDCYQLEIRHIQSAMNHLAKLTRFEMNNTKIENLGNVHSLLNEMPNLECLSLMQYPHGADLGGLLASLFRLSSLRALHLYKNNSVTDEWLVAAARGCPSLRIVDVGRCSQVSARGVVELCRLRPMLTELWVRSHSLTDADLEACARCCRGLELLDASWCLELTQGLPARLAWPRARPLRLQLYGATVKKEQICYEGLTMLWNKIPRRYYYVCRT